MKERFKYHKLHKAGLEIIDHAVRIIDEYQAEGFSLTLRQLFYQFVARELLPNTQRSYKRLGDIVNNARLTGLIDWEAIEDRTRFVRRVPSWENPRQILLSAARNYMIDPWLDQPKMIEVWIEKDALVGVVEPVCDKWRIPLFSCRGYTSQSAMYVAAKRHEEYMRHPLRTVCLDDIWVFHLGDHDPSGLDMTRGIMDRLAMFGSIATVYHLALNREQIDRHYLPPNPAKLTDSRYRSYIEEYGTESWELDAMPPGDLATLVNEEVMKDVDVEAWRKSMVREEEERQQLNKIVVAWEREE